MATLNHKMFSKINRSVIMKKNNNNKYIFLLAMATTCLEHYCIVEEDRLMTLNLLTLPLCVYKSAQIINPKIPLIDRRGS